MDTRAKQRHMAQAMERLGFTKPRKYQWFSMPLSDDWQAVASLGMATRTAGAPGWARVNPLVGLRYLPLENFIDQAPVPTTAPCTISTSLASLHEEDDDWTMTADPDSVAAVTNNIMHTIETVGLRWCRDNATTEAVIATLCPAGNWTPSKYRLPAMLFLHGDRAEALHVTAEFRAESAGRTGEVYENLNVYLDWLEHAAADL